MPQNHIAMKFKGTFNRYSFILGIILVATLVYLTMTMDLGEYSFLIPLLFVGMFSNPISYSTIRYEITETSLITKQWLLEADVIVLDDIKSIKRKKYGFFGFLFGFPSQILEIEYGNYGKRRILNTDQAVIDKLIAVTTVEQLEAA